MLNMSAKMHDHSLALNNMKQLFTIAFLLLSLVPVSGKGQLPDSLTSKKLVKHFYQSFLNEEEDVPGYSTVIYGLIHVSPQGRIDSFFVSTGDRYGIMLGKAIQTIPEHVPLQFEGPAVMMVHVVYKQESDGRYLYDSEKSMYLEKSFLSRISQLNGRPLYMIGPLEFTSWKPIR